MSPHPLQQQTRSHSPTFDLAGINPRCYSQHLMDASADFITLAAEPMSKVAMEALQIAWENNPWPGASTATLAVVSGKNLDVASIGDTKAMNINKTAQNLL